MKTSPLLAILLVSAMVPAVLAHDPTGTPRNYCEAPSEWATHEYAPPATGSFVALLQDGNILGDCNGDGTPADFDGHLEFAFGGAWILAESGDGVTSGSIACYGAASDHPYFGPFLTVDNLLGSGAAYLVEADNENLVPPTDPSAPNCGDFTSDVGANCVGVCTVTFPPGLDGAYIVYVTGTAGHTCSPAVNCPNVPSPLDPVYTPGPAAAMTFDGSGGPPSVTASPGWECTGPALVDGLWEIECEPPRVLSVAGILPACTIPWGLVGGSAVSSGTGSVRVGCKQFFGGFASVGCTSTWSGSGGCVAPLLGFYDFPIRCAAHVVGTTIGGNFVASCGHV